MSELLGIARFDFRDGDVAEFKRLSEEAMEIVREKEPGTLEYSVYFNADETEAIVIERYRDSEALLQHAKNLDHLMEPVIATGSVHGELLGDPSPELRANFSEDGPVQLLTPWLSLVE
ncbi:putative quinol monooxygenase [Mumia sp. DW29H23]|uniref:putative quinol monooxygenase n=1 Tax=Mumia sp. DW29H23 TaxID=3421241 RepID=UPI003D693912